jgi:hypothetical protein
MHPEIHQPAAQAGPVDPFGDLAVMFIGHQQRQGEIVQQPLDGAFPVALVFEHADQLAGKGQAVFGQVQGLAELFANGQAVGRQIVAPGLKRFDLGANVCVASA